MRLVLFGILFALSAGLAETQSEGASYALGFMNITTDTNEVGFVQIYVVSINMTTARVQSKISGYDNFTQVGSVANTFFNATLDFDQLTVSNRSDKLTGAQNQNQLGILVSTRTHAHVYGIKSDRGTTDGYLALPLTTDSKGFFVAGWECVDQMFFGGFQVVAAFQDTCLEIYEVKNGTYKRANAFYLKDQFDSLTWTSNVKNPSNPNQLVQDYDITGIYINSSKPIAVYAGHSCAFVPNRETSYCDHMVEQIPPTSELGTLHIVIPIVGRRSSAGYVVRVVATEWGTTVEWKDSTSTITGSNVLNQGDFEHIFQTDASRPMEVKCSKRCLVMQYNTGRNSPNPNGPSDPVPTDPFMLLIVPVERFDHSSGFATANFCDNKKSRVIFNNFVAIVVKKDQTQNVLLNGRTLNTWSVSWDYAIATENVAHGHYTITVVRGSGTLFAAYVYGHSVLDSSSSSYAYAAAFQENGTLEAQNWVQADAVLKKKQEEERGVTCKIEKVYSGSAVATYAPFPGVSSVVGYAINLDVDPVKMSIPTMTSYCRAKYKAAIVEQLLNISREINYRICTKAMCSYMTGAAGGGVPLGGTNVLTGGALFVAIDTSDLANAVTLDFTASTGLVTAVHVTVPYVGVTDTNSAAYAQCRKEIRDFLRPFANWPLDVSLVPDLSAEGCGRMTFNQPIFVTNQFVCPSP